MGLHLTPIDVVEDISQEDFRKKYLLPRKAGSHPQHG